MIKKFLCLSIATTIAFSLTITTFATEAPQISDKTQGGFVNPFEASSWGTPNDIEGMRAEIANYSLQQGQMEKEFDAIEFEGFKKPSYELPKFGKKVIVKPSGKIDKTLTHKKIDTSKYQQYSLPEIDTSALDAQKKRFLQTDAVYQAETKKDLTNEYLNSLTDYYEVDHNGHRSLKEGVKEEDIPKVWEGYADCGLMTDAEFKTEKTKRKTKEKDVKYMQGFINSGLKDPETYEKSKDGLITDRPFNFDFESKKLQAEIEQQTIENEMVEDKYKKAKVADNIAKFAPVYWLSKGVRAIID